MIYSRFLLELATCPPAWYTTKQKCLFEALDRLGEDRLFTTSPPMIVAIHQPHYLPWLGYLDKLDRADAFVVLDTVQFVRREHQNRNRIRTADGWTWLTVPVKSAYKAPLLEVTIDNEQTWSRKHLQALKLNYSRAPHFMEHLPFLTDTYAKLWPKLVEFCLHTLTYLKEAFGIVTPVHLASSFETHQEPTARLIDLCKALEAETYLAGVGGRNYMDMKMFEEAKIAVEFQEFTHPVYPQCFEHFEPAMAAIDLLFNCGKGGFEVVRQARENLL